MYLVEKWVVLFGTIYPTLCCSAVLYSWQQSLDPSYQYTLSVCRAGNWSSSLSETLCGLLLLWRSENKYGSEIVYMKVYMFSCVFLLWIVWLCTCETYCMYTSFYARTTVSVTVWWRLTFANSFGLIVARRRGTSPDPTMSLIHNINIHSLK